MATGAEMSSGVLHQAAKSKEAARGRGRPEEVRVDMSENSWRKDERMKQRGSRERIQSEAKAREKLFEPGKEGRKALTSV
jgi:hypothetical protein